MGGSCSFSKKSAGTTNNIIKLSNNNHRNSSNRNHNSNRNQNEMPQNENQINFQDLPEYGQDEYIGEGIKKIKAYHCDIPLDKLAMLRQNFWASHKQNRRIWQILKNVCEADALTAEQLLISANLVALDGSIKCVVDPYSGAVFNIPNFCISDPLFKRVNHQENIPKEEKIIKIELIYVFTNTNHNLKISNKSSGLDVKISFCKLENIEFNQYQIRLLSKGQEIKNDALLCFYNIDDGDKIQVSCRKLDELEL